MIEYHHLMNRSSHGLLYLTLQSMGDNEYGIIQSLVYFNFFEAFNNAFEMQFIWASLSHFIAFRH